MSAKKSKLDEAFVFQSFNGMRDFAEYQRCVNQSREEYVAEGEDADGRAMRASLMAESMKKDMSSIATVEKRFGDRALGEGFLIVVRHKDDMPSGPVAGCIGCVRNSPFQLELVRLFVDSRFRGWGLGKSLVQHVLDYAEEHQYEQVFLYCGAKNGQALYGRMGFHRSGFSFFWRPVKSSNRSLEKVVLVGGTHGNELVGTHLINEVWKDGKELASIAGDSFKVETVIANPEAMKLCVRFVDRDLNRCFALDELETPLAEEATKYETRRSQELNRLYGPKRHIPGSFAQWKRENPSCFDYMIDMHGTTSNMCVCV
jgi:GNAT superfamily N-acetyltransferase